MRKITLGVYDSYADACSAQRALGEAGVAQADIAIYSMSADAPIDKGPRVYAPGGGDVRHHKPVFDQLEQLFARRFKRGEYPPETEDYREFIRCGGTVVSADVAEMQIDLAREATRRAGAADIGERSSAWRNGSAETSMSEHAPHPGSPAARDSSSQYESATGRQDATMLSSGRVACTAPSLDEMVKSVTPRDTSPASALPPEFASDASVQSRSAVVQFSNRRTETNVSILVVSLLIFVMAVPSSDARAEVDQRCVSVQISICNSTLAQCQCTSSRRTNDANSVAEQQRRCTQDCQEAYQKCVADATRSCYR
jgi:hypothetical protein